MDFVFYLTLFLFILLFGNIYNNIDFDFWARLIVGKSFFQTGTLFNNDFYSYGKTHEFIDHEWGSSLIFYLIQDNFGDIGLHIFKSIIIFLTIFLITKIIRLENKNTKLHFLFFFFAIQSVSYNIFSTIRCQTFSFLFFVLFLYILQYARKKECYRALWTLPILNVIWVNVHGGFVLGIALIAIFLIGEFINNKNSKINKYLTITLFSTVLTTLINPYGIKYITYIINALTLNRVHITEWQSAFFDKAYIYEYVKFKIFFLLSVFLMTYTLIKHNKKIDFTKYILLFFTTIIALKAIRCHVFFSYCVLALCYCDFYNIFSKKLPKIIDNTKEIIIFLLILISTISHIYKNKFENIVYKKDYPIFCVEFIKKNNLKGNVYTMFHTGSYVIYKLYPNNHIFMDGRYEEVYDNKLINEMGKMHLAKDNNEFLSKYHNDILIIDKFYPVYSTLKQNKNWFLAFESDNFALFLPSILKNKKFLQPTKEKDYYYKTKFETSINWL